MSASHTTGGSTVSPVAGNSGVGAAVTGIRSGPAHRGRHTAAEGRMSQGSDEQHEPVPDRPERAVRREPEQPAETDEDAMTDEDARARDTAPTEES